MFRRATLRRTIAVVHPAERAQPTNRMRHVVRKKIRLYTWAYAEPQHRRQLHSARRANVRVVRAQTKKQPQRTHERRALLWKCARTMRRRCAEDGMEGGGGRRQQLSSRTKDVRKIIKINLCLKQLLNPTVPVYQLIRICHLRLLKHTQYSKKRAREQCVPRDPNWFFARLRPRAAASV